jgi:16S rRNA (guanine1207-N2)-methyltransferase
MNEHYFSQKPQTKSSPKTWYYQTNGKQYTFTSDVGVFSKREVDFGSRLLIEQFKEPTVPGDFLDLGCGYGPIGILVADRYPSRHMVMVDINERAVKLAAENARQNGVTNMTCLQSDKLADVKNRTFAAVLTNPPIRAGKQVVHEMFTEAQQVIVQGGSLWVVIQKKQGAPSAKKKLEQLFAAVETVAKRKGYYILRADKV